MRFVNNLYIVNLSVDDLLAVEVVIGTGFFKPIRDRDIIRLAED